MIDFNKQNGFNLIELLVTLLIAVIITVIAYPYLQYQRHQLEQRRVISAFDNTFNLSKVSAFTYRLPVILCLADRDYACDKRASSRIISFIDKNMNNQYDITDTMLVDTQLQPKYGNLYLTSSNRSYIKFALDTGMPRGHFGHIQYCSQSTATLHAKLTFTAVGVINYKETAEALAVC